MAEPVVVRSAIKSVSVFRKGAVVSRVAELPGGTPDQIAVDGLPLAIEDDSVRVRVEGSGPLPRPTDVRVELVVPSIGESITPPSEKEIEEAEDDAERIASQIARIDQEIALLSRITIQLPPVFQNRPPRPAPAAAWSGALDWTGRAKKQRVEEKSKLEEEMRRASEKVARLRRREEQAHATRDVAEDKVRKRLLVRLRDGEAKGNLVVEYRVPGASWRPTYVVRMARDGRSAALGIRALVAQSSGEAWERVKIALSTADLLARADLPELKSLRIGRRQPEPPARAWRPPPTGLEPLFEGIDRAMENEPRLYDADYEIGESGGDDHRSRSRPRPASGKGYGGKPMRPPEPPRPMQQRVPVAEASPMPPPPPMKSVRAPADAISAPVSAAAPVMAGAPPAMPRGMPPPGAARASARSRAADKNGAAGGSFEDAPPEEEMAYDEGSADLSGLMDMDDAKTAEPMLQGAGRRRSGEVVLFRYAELVMASWRDEEWTRGKLRPIGIADRVRGLSEDAAPTVESLIADAIERAESAAEAEFPDETRAVQDSAGAYDYRYDAEGLVDVPSDGKVHSIPLLTQRAPVATTLVVVPRESTQAVRVATMKNPLASPLLAGPAEIYLEDEYLVTSPIRTVPAGAELKVGLGVEEALKVARNVHFDEEKAGLLGGSATLAHRVEIEVASRMSVPVKVEVRERVPIKDDETSKDVEIVVGEPSPPWEDFDQADTNRIKGGKRWRLSLGAGESKKLTFAWTVKIDAKNEIVGGNRRD